MNSVIWLWAEISPKQAWKEKEKDNGTHEEGGRLMKPCGFESQEIYDCSWSQFPMETEREISLEKAENNSLKMQRGKYFVIIWLIIRMS